MHRKESNKYSTNSFCFKMMSYCKDHKFSNPGVYFSQLIRQSLLKKNQNSSCISLDMQKFRMIRTILQGFSNMTRLQMKETKSIIRNSKLLQILQYNGYQLCLTKFSLNSSIKCQTFQKMSTYLIMQVKKSWCGRLAIGTNARFMIKLIQIAIEDLDHI